MKYENETMEIAFESFVSCGAYFSQFLKENIDQLNNDYLDYYNDCNDKKKEPICFPDFSYMAMISILRNMIEEEIKKSIYE